MSTSVETTGMSLGIGSVAGSGPGTLQEPGVDHLGPSLNDVAGADEHFEPVTRDGQVAAHAGPPVDS